MTAASAVEAASIPWDEAAERAVIGVLLMSTSRLGDVAETLRPEDFHRPALSAVYESILALDARGEAVDIGTVLWEVERSAGRSLIEGNDLVTLVAEAPSTSAVMSYARRIADLAGKRELVNQGHRIAELGRDTNVELAAAIEEAEGSLFALRRTQGHESRSLVEGLAEWRRTATTRQDGVINPTGFRDIDRRLGGLVPGRLVIVGARPGVGKTSFAGAMALNVAHRAPVLFVSLEMSEQELLARFIATESGLNVERLTQRRLGEQELAHVDPAIDRLLSLPMVIEDNGITTMVGVRAAARKTLRKHGSLGLIVVDYLQLMTSSSRKVETRQVEVAELSRGLKMLAKELAVPVVALSQLNRTLENRVEKVPTLSDLRESGAIEQDADQVLMLYRDELYDEFSTERGVAQVHVVKNRHGRTGVVKLSADLACGRWSDLAQAEER